MAGLATEIALHQMGDISPLSDAALTAFWALFAYAAQTMVLKRAIRILEREAKTATVS